jgi:hypothetical protein
MNPKRWCGVIVLLLGFDLCALLVTESMAACNTFICHEYGYFGGNDPPDDVDCWDVETDGADTLLAANTTGGPIRMTAQQQGGTQTVHPSIKFRLRDWTVCSFDCASYTGPDTVGVTVSGTASPSSIWFPANYCKPGT